MDLDFHTVFGSVARLMATRLDGQNFVPSAAMTPSA